MNQVRQVRGNQSQKSNQNSKHSHTYPQPNPQHNQNQSHIHQNTIHLSTANTNEPEGEPHKKHKRDWSKRREFFLSFNRLTAALPSATTTIVLSLRQELLSLPSTETANHHRRPQSPPRKLPLLHRRLATTTVAPRRSRLHPVLVRVVPVPLTSPSCCYRRAAIVLPGSATRNPFSLCLIVP